LVVGVSLAAGSAVVPASAAATTRIDLRVLLLGTSATEPDFLAWEAALQREGVPFDTAVDSSAGVLTLPALSDTTSTGVQEGKYEAIIEAIGGLPVCATTCTAGITTTQAATLESYESTFGVRQITGDVYPSTAYGLSTPTTSGALDGTTATLTADGLTDFPYLKGPVSMDTGTYGYEAVPATSSTGLAAGASYDSLVNGPAGSSLVGIYTDPSGVQQLVETFDANQYQLQSELLRHGALAWVTRGVYFGDQRNYLETNVDDNFLSDDSWDTTTKATDYDPTDALREVGSDIVNAAKWSDANDFRIDELFNGGGSVDWAAGCTADVSGDGGGSGSSSTGCSNTAPGTDPLLAQLQSTCTTNCGPGNAGAGKSYANSFGWINHTWDHPNLDQGCATQNYIEAEIQENSNWAAEAPGSAKGNPNTGGLGLIKDTTGQTALGAENPEVVVTGEHSGLANLLPGNPGIVDPPSWDAATAGTTGGALAPGTYVYAIVDQFTSTGGLSEASETTVTIPASTKGSTTKPGLLSGLLGVLGMAPKAANSVKLTWEAVCHASDYKIYREVSGSNSWKLLSTIAAPTTAPPNSSFGNPTSTTVVGAGGALEQTYTDTGAAGTSATAPSTTANAATESAYQQNTVLPAAFTAIGIKAFGADSSKPYPNPATATFTTGSPPATEFAAGQTFTDGGAQAEPRYPTNIYYNVSTEAQEVSEYNYLYLPASLGGECVNSSTTTCLTAPATFSQIIASIDTGMFQHMMGNDPRPDYFHQPNMMGTPPAGSEAGTGDLPPTSWTPPATAPATGDGLYYSTLDPLLSEYALFFSVPIQQPTTLQIAELLAEQAAWAATSTVSGYIQGNQVTITNAGASAVTAPLTGILTVGTTYGGTQSGWTSIPAGTSTYTSATTWPVS
jgi:hypothetical protein